MGINTFCFFLRKVLVKFTGEMHLTVIFTNTDTKNNNKKMENSIVSP